MPYSHQLSLKFPHNFLVPIIFIHSPRSPPYYFLILFIGSNRRPGVNHDTLRRKNANMTFNEMYSI
jgi:hypothetical protein